MYILHHPDIVFPTATRKKGADRCTDTLVSITEHVSPAFQVL